MSVWFASFAPDALNTCHLLLNRAIGEHAFRTAKGIEVISITIMRTWRCDDRDDFMAAVLSAISLRDRPQRQELAPYSNVNGSSGTAARKLVNS